MNVRCPRREMMEQVWESAEVVLCWVHVSEETVCGVSLWLKTCNKRGFAARVRGTGLSSLLSCCSFRCVWTCWRSLRSPHPGRTSFHLWTYSLQWCSKPHSSSNVHLSALTRVASHTHNFETWTCSCVSAHTVLPVVWLFTHNVKNLCESIHLFKLSSLLKFAIPYRNLNYTDTHPHGGWYFDVCFIFSLLTMAVLGLENK